MTRADGMRAAAAAAPTPSTGRREIKVLTYKTLGNGYLGPRIDEERSKMRYLV